MKYCVKPAHHAFLIRTNHVVLKSIIRNDASKFYNTVLGMYTYRTQSYYFIYEDTMC